MVIRKEVFERDFQVDKIVLALIEKKSDVCLFVATRKVIIRVFSIEAYMVIQIIINV